MPDVIEHPQLTEAREFAEKLRELARTSPDKVALVVHAEEMPISLFANRPMRLRSTYKTAIGLAYAKEAARDPSFASKTVSISAVDKVDPGYFDGGAHAGWKASLPAGAQEVSHEAIAKGMLQDSSNTCTQYMLDLLGHEKVNAIIAEHQLELPAFAKTYDELYNPLRGSASETVKLMEAIAKKETPGVRSAFQSVASRIQVISAEHGGAAGFGKGGSGIMPILGGVGGYRHDFNHAWCFEHNGKSVSACLMMNNLDTSTKEFLEQRFASFAAETSCNNGFRAKCAKMFETSIVSALHGIGLLKQTHLPPL